MKYTYTLVNQYHPLKLFSSRKKNLVQHELLCTIKEYLLVCKCVLNLSNLSFNHLQILQHADYSGKHYNIIANTYWFDCTTLTFRSTYKDNFFYCGKENDICHNVINEIKNLLSQNNYVNTNIQQKVPVNLSRTPMPIQFSSGLDEITVDKIKNANNVEVLDENDEDKLLQQIQSLEQIKEERDKEFDELEKKMKEEREALNMEQANLSVKKKRISET